MVSFNRVVLAGNLTRDPELRFTKEGVPVAGFGLAVNRVRSKSDEVDFFDVSAWRELGETVANYKKKGDPILLEVRLQYRTWKAQDGSGARRSKVDVVADNIPFLGSGEHPVPRKWGWPGERRGRQRLRGWLCRELQERRPRGPGAGNRRGKLRGHPLRRKLRPQGEDRPRHPLGGGAPIFPGRSDRRGHLGAEGLGLFLPKKAEDCAKKGDPA